MRITLSNQVHERIVNIYLIVYFVISEKVLKSVKIQ